VKKGNRCCKHEKIWENFSWSRLTCGGALKRGKNKKKINLERKSRNWEEASGKKKALAGKRKGARRERSGSRTPAQGKKGVGIVQAVEYKRGREESGGVERKRLGIQGTEEAPQKGDQAGLRRETLGPRMGIEKTTNGGV